MSKSYKKQPFCVIENISKKDRRIMNKKIRKKKLEEYPTGATYRKEFSFERKWKLFWPKEQAIQNFYDSKHFTKKYQNLDDFLLYWEKCIKRK